MKPFERAFILARAALAVLGSGAEVTAGERAVAYASLAQVDATLSLARVLMARSTDVEIGVDLLEIEELLEGAIDPFLARLAGFEDDDGSP